MSPPEPAVDPALLAALGEAIGHATGPPAAIETATPVGGGSISRALLVDAGRRRYFVKINEAGNAGMFAAEADGLAALAACPAVRVPRVVGQGTSGDHAWLILEYLALRPLRSHGDGASAGRALAELHRITGDRYGWPSDNFIGSTPQHNAAERTWPLFFARQRLLPQIELARRRGYAGQLIDDGLRLAEALPALLVGHQPPPSLVHGDLWSGNTGSDDSGKFAIFDPAVYCGDRETDLAMTELFGGFPDGFYAAYRDAWPLADGYEQRKKLYNLYHVLNHLNLFGRGYLREAERMTGRLLADLRG